LLRNEGSVFIDVTRPPLDDDRKGQGFGWGDYDKDGDLDIYLVNCSYSWTNCLFQNHLESGRPWLEVRLVGTTSNSFGQGARVRIVAGDLAQMREIAGASGYLSQGPLTAWFGLGGVCTVDTLEVTWPASGIVQTITDVACNQTLEITEEDLSGVADGAEKAAALRLYTNQPNPFRSMTLIRYDLCEAGRVDLDVFDITGRLVRKLVDHHLTGRGRHTAIWDGRNADGRPVGPGIYFCRLSAGSRTQIQRMVLLK
jgi:hypothetical protein